MNFLRHSFNYFKKTPIRSTISRPSIPMDDYNNNKSSFISKNNFIHPEYQYLDVLYDTVYNSEKRNGRNGLVYSVFGRKMEFDITNYKVPLLSTKKVYGKMAGKELLFFLKGQTNAKILTGQGVPIWEPNTTRNFLNNNNLAHYEEGDMGPMYGFQWLHFGTKYVNCDHDYSKQGFNQFEYVLKKLKTDPFSRRIMMTTYNPAQADEGVLFPCHGISIVFDVSSNYELSCGMTMRSNDIFLGNPFNIFQYSFLVHIMCKLINNDNEYTGTKFSPGKLCVFLNNVHLYEEHLEQAKEQLLRTPLLSLPHIEFMNNPKEIKEINLKNIKICNYEHLPEIKGKMVA